MDARNGHDIEQVYIALGMSTTSTVKIVSMTDFKKTVDEIKLLYN